MLQRLNEKVICSINNPLHVEGGVALITDGRFSGVTRESDRVFVSPEAA